MVRRTIPVVLLVLALAVAGVAVWVPLRVLRETEMAAADFRRGVRRVEKFVDQVEELPEMSQEAAAAWPLPAEGVLVTVKQRTGAWLPGGKYRLAVGDITGGQVMVTVTDGAGRSAVYARSVKTGDTIHVGDGAERRVVVVERLHNLLAGGDFGEFRVLADPGR